MDNLLQQRIGGERGEGTRPEKDTEEREGSGQDNRERDQEGNGQENEEWNEESEGDTGNGIEKNKDQQTTQRKRRKPQGKLLTLP